ncbi:hypothetical protein [Sulfitobacter donghicola]|uniref:Uncharacterized protein n=1 Tax=Sulfitobacter donghicola DSW-25 = KCTC 12864 = JCM 14565 TaxID=1300350 RepID=A0A073J0B7_9RHOB|nr:hypothetical protein [Sulfitobacter donghicola]KEJ91097.1 hypothetical protein DSW25_03825 [Sulfitobacter donghicola DSW-25 = KCTC 12864 = JCM 14565]KIN68331.1 hypothetical protein Z948_2060 [Sulfitobacter donghicola DSW-25 = KCTC 12864 = JCM 14565]
MNRIVWAFLPLAACTTISAEQRDWQQQTEGLPQQTLSLSCASGPKEVHVLGTGQFAKADGLIFICTTPLAGGLACSAENQRRIIDFETRTAVRISKDGHQDTCQF